MLTCGEVFCFKCTYEENARARITRNPAHHSCEAPKKKPGLFYQAVSDDEVYDVWEDSKFKSYINVVDITPSDEGMLIVDQARKHVKLCSLSVDNSVSKPLKKFKVRDRFGLLKTVKVFDDLLYICQTSAVTVYTFYQKQIKEYKTPPGQHSVLSSIVVLSSMMVLVADEVQGIIFHPDFTTNERNPVIAGLDTPRYMSLGDDKLAVSCSGTFTNKPSVHIYDFYWQQLFCLELELIPWGIVFLPSGNILVSLKKCIYEYSLNTGQYVRCVLGEKDGINQESNIKLYNGELFVLELNIHGKDIPGTRGFRIFPLEDIL